MAERARDVERWLPEARAGSADALGWALEACRGYLLLIAQQELGTDLQAKGGASDLVQDTFLKAHRHFGRFQGTTEAELLSWLRRVLLNNLADFRATYQEATKRRAAREVTLEPPDSSAGHGAGPADDAPSPSGHAVAREVRDAVRQGLERLPEDYRRALLLRFEEDRSFEDIGRLMGCTPNAARKLWARAVKRLQQEMGGSPP